MAASDVAAEADNAARVLLTGPLRLAAGISRDPEFRTDLQLWMTMQCLLRPLLDANALSQRGHGYGIVPVDVPLHNDLRLSCLQSLNFHGYCCLRRGRPITAGVSKDTSVDGP